jgi:hypothetical protein
MRAEIDGLVTDIKTIHERVDSTVTTANTRFDQLDLAQTATNTALDAIMSQLDALNTVVTDLVAQGCVVDDEQEGVDRRGKAGRVPRHSTGNDSFSKIKFKIPPFNGKYDPAAYLDWEIEVEQKFSCHDIVATSQVKAVISEFTDFALIWWHEYKNKNPTAVLTTWEQLKTAIRHRLVPSYYARDLLTKMQRFQQGSESVEDYYKELQKGMIHCGGLNREIQDILDYKEYADMTQLFEFACKAEREVQGRRSRTYSNTFAGRNSSSSSAPALPAPSTPTPREKTTTPAGAALATGAASTQVIPRGREAIPTKDISDTCKLSKRASQEDVIMIHFMQSLPSDYNSVASDSYPSGVDGVGAV